jgi:hypothetical protein
MSGFGTKIAEEHKYLPERTITVENGDVIQPDRDVYVRPRAIVKFSNYDAESYTITFLLHDQNRIDLWPKHADVDLFLPAFGSATMVVDPDVEIGQCDYLVEETNPSSVGVRLPLNKLEETAVGGGGAPSPVQTASVNTASSDAPPPPTRLLVVRTASRGGGGGTIHIGG